jgi:putative radical SAM enzyme (TIGR03279 family)
MVKVTGVAPGSIAEKLGLIPGTDLLAVDGHPLHDFLDWEFLSAEESFVLRARFPGGGEIEYEVQRDGYQPIGVTLEPPRIRRCANRCDFCFVDGLPPGLRDSLYIRDDDYRLSFRYGNFATLTNLKPWDTRRIVEYRLTPLYVSVHATDLTVRRWLLRNPMAPDILDQLRSLAAHGIQFHTQVVLAPGVNDGPVLDRTLADLYELGDPILTVAVVPVGLTAFSRHDRCREPTPAECRAAVAQVEQWSSRAWAERRRPWVQGADELYLRAGLPLPPEEAYGEFEQVENGVGAVRWLQREVRTHVNALQEWAGQRIVVCTGTSMGALMPDVLGTVAQVSGAEFELLVLQNSLFGPSVTSAGLLPGRAFLAALRERERCDLALIPGEALNDEARFLDDLSFEELARSVPMPVSPSRYFADAVAEVEAR